MIELLDIYLKYYDDKPSVDDHLVNNQIAVFNCKLEIYALVGQYLEALEMIETAKTKFYTEDQDTWAVRRHKILTYEYQCYKAQQNHSATLKVLREIVEVWKEFKLPEDAEL